MDAAPEYEMVFIEETGIAVPFVTGDGYPPTKAHDHDAAFDLTSCGRHHVPPGATMSVPTGIRLAIPEGHVGLICPRSGLAATFGITVANSPGVIDAGYRGDVCVLVRNESRDSYWIHRGDRIAQLLILKLPLAYMAPVDRLPPPADKRGEGGFGSTGR